MARIVGMPCPASTPSPAIIKSRDEHYPGLLNRTFAVDVVTPIFGGGVEPGEIDPIAAVRASAVRGHLRSWWRATTGLAFPTAIELRKREREVWGAPNIESRVKVEVRVLDPGRDISADELRRDNNILYAIFPFQENRREHRPCRVGRRGVRFQITVRYPDTMKADVVPALAAWMLFGGVGARVRRGLGALWCRDFAPPAADRDGRWFHQFRTSFKVPPSADRAWPVLGDTPLVSAPVQDAQQAWAKAIGLLRDFRQGYGTGRRPGPGRSFWPEADSLRGITGRGEDRHMDTLTVQDPGFPRAELGMPIVMHFKDPQDRANDCEIEPNEPGMKTNRMASPIILRPLGTADGRFVAMAMRLRAPKPAGIRIKAFGYVGGPTEVERAELATYPGSPMKGTRGSALDAFMAFAKARI